MGRRFHSWMQLIATSAWNPAGPAGAGRSSGCHLRLLPEIRRPRFPMSAEVTMCPEKENNNYCGGRPGSGSQGGLAQPAGRFAPLSPRPLGAWSSFDPPPAAANRGSCPTAAFGSFEQSHTSGRGNRARRRKWKCYHAKGDLFPSLTGSAPARFDLLL